MINAQTLYSLIVEMSDASLVLRYGANAGINSIRLVSDAAYLVTGASLLAEASSSAPVQHLPPWLLVYQQKAVKNGLNLRQRIKTYKQYRCCRKSACALNARNMPKQHALTPHYVVLLKKH